MRILHGIVSGSFAGVERHVARLAAAQAAAGHDVHVVGGASREMSAELVTSGGSASHEPADGVGHLVRTVRRHVPGLDVLHVHMTAAEIAATLALTGLRRPDRPVVVSTRHFARPRGHGPTAALVGSVAARRVDAQIAISRYVAAEVDGTSVVVVPGVDARPDAPTARQRQRSVLLVQRLQPEKRTAVGLRAFAAAGLTRQGWHLDVVGDGAERAALEGEADRLGLGRSVRFHGRRDDVPDLLRDGGILLAPCDVEGLGLSVLEAMAAGLPVVAAASGGHRELLDGVDPVCLPAGDETSMGRSLARLAEDPDLRDTVAEVARERQRALYTLDGQQAGTLDVYARVLRGSGRTVGAR
jgi:glycosyltransferase involved in cell wall biosynthesis